jgi:hypothetical protein
MVELAEYMSTNYIGARGSVVVKALCHKPEGRGFDSRWSEFLNLHNLSGRTRPWDLLSFWQKWVPEMFLGSKVRLVRKADNLTAIYEPIV